MANQNLGVGIIGCGNIAGPYAHDLATYDTIDLRGVADEAIDLVINLTIHHAHTAVTTQCLEAGKHVHSEKPLSLTYDEAKGLVALGRL